MKKDVIERSEGKLSKYKKAAEDLSKMVIREKKNLKKL